MPEIVLPENDVPIVVEILSEKLKQVEDENEHIKERGWSGTGAVGYYIIRLKEIIAKLGG